MSDEPTASGTVVLALAPSHFPTLDIPREVVMRIFEVLAPIAHDDPEHYKRRNDLQQCCLSRPFRVLAQPSLWHLIRVAMPQNGTALINAARDRPVLARNSEIFVGDGRGTRLHAGQAMVAAFLRKQYVKDLSFLFYAWNAHCTFFASSLVRFPKLRQLHDQQSSHQGPPTRSAYFGQPLIARSTKHEVCVNQLELAALLSPTGTPTLRALSLGRLCDPQTGHYFLPAISSTLLRRLHVLNASESVTALQSFPLVAPPKSKLSVLLSAPLSSTHEGAYSLRRSKPTHLQLKPDFAWIYQMYMPSGLDSLTQYILDAQRLRTLIMPSIPDIPALLTEYTVMCRNDFLAACKANDVQILWESKAANQAERLCRRFWEYKEEMPKRGEASGR